MDMFFYLEFFQGRIIWITFGWGIGGRNFMLVRGENLPMKYPWGRKRAEPAKFCIEGLRDAIDEVGGDQRSEAGLQGVPDVARA